VEATLDGADRHLQKLAHLGQGVPVDVEEGGRHALVLRKGADRGQHLLAGLPLLY
jgi:hypothetical protein